VCRWPATWMGTLYTEGATAFSKSFNIPCWYDDALGKIRAKCVPSMLGFCEEPACDSMLVVLVARSHQPLAPPERCGKDDTTFELQVEHTTRIVHLALLLKDI
jgi:hypothetical protein